jgi:hypothetical protein
LFGGVGDGAKKIQAAMETLELNDIAEKMTVRLIDVLGKDQKSSGTNTEPIDIIDSVFPKQKRDKFVVDFLAALDIENPYASKTVPSFVEESFVPATAGHSMTQSIKKTQQLYFEPWETEKNDPNVDPDNNFIYYCKGGSNDGKTFALYDAVTLTTRQKKYADATWGSDTMKYACVQGCMNSAFDLDLRFNETGSATSKNNITAWTHYLKKHKQSLPKKNSCLKMDAGPLVDFDRGIHAFDWARKDKCADSAVVLKFNFGDTLFKFERFGVHTSLMSLEGNAKIDCRLANDPGQCEKEKKEREFETVENPMEFEMTNNPMLVTAGNPDSLVQLQNRKATNQEEKEKSRKREAKKV